MLIIQIEESDVDILCLQEIFYGDIQRQIYADLSQTYPYILSNLDFSAEFNTNGACTLSEIQQMSECIAAQCSSFTDPTEQFACIALK